MKSIQPKFDGEHLSALRDNEIAKWLAADVAATNVAVNGAPRCYFCVRIAILQMQRPAVYW